ncbi:MAG: hypothetical protein JSS75_00500 [Bacteroidetes bacterium]|nr:hypothetical protein [Bacteroidota bacterium]
MARSPLFIISVFFLALLVKTADIHGQGMQIHLSISPHPSLRLTDWQSRREIASLLITNTTNKNVDARIVASLTLNGNEVASTRTESMPVLSITPGQSTYYGGDLFPSNALTFKGDASTTTLRTGMLPEGNYELCVHLVAADTRETISPLECRSFFLTRYSLPQLLQPANAATITSGLETSTLFSWTPIVPTPQSAVVYRLKVVELLPNQHPKQAILNNRSFFERVVTNVTQLMWPAEFRLPSQGGDFVWSVQAEDPDGSPINMPERFAEPNTLIALPSQEECLRLLLSVTNRSDSLMRIEESYWQDYAQLERLRKELLEAEARADVYDTDKLKPRIASAEERVKAQVKHHESVRALYDAAMDRYRRCTGR